MLRYQGRLLSGIPTRCCKCIRYTHTGVSLDIIRYPTSNELRCACRGQAERFDKIERSWSLQGNERHVLVSVLCTFRKQVRCFDGVQCTSFGTTSNCAITARSWSVPLGWPIATDLVCEDKSKTQKAPVTLFTNAAMGHACLWRRWGLRRVGRQHLLATETVRLETSASI